MQSIPEVVFFCGGYGSRMGELTKEKQKCMLLYKEKPIMEYGLEEVYRHLGKFRPIFATSYRSDDVKNYFGKSWKGMPITYVDHALGVESRGTIESLESVVRNSIFLTIHGNITFNGSILPAMLDVHANNYPLTTIALAPKVEESSHNLARVGKFNRVENILPLNPGEAKLEQLIKDDVHFSTYTKDMSYEEMRTQKYMREPGINVYDSRIFEYVHSYPASVTHINWLYADRLSKGDEVLGVVHEADWTHFQAPEDFMR